MAGAQLWQINVTGVPEQAVDAVSEALEPFFQGVVAMEAEKEKAWAIQGYSGERPEKGKINAALAAVSEAFDAKPFAWSAEEQADKGWLSDNLADFPAQRMGRLHIMGSHIKAQAPLGTIPVLMDATTAFGSGRHPTTEGCLLALQKTGVAEGGRALDMGCGTGILAIAYARLFHRPVMAGDMDPAAIKVTRKQAQENQIAPLIRAVRADGFAHPDIRRAGPYGLIMANILARPLQRMAGDLVASLLPKGNAILSGFYVRDALWVAAPYLSRGMRIKGMIEIDGWATLILSKPQAAVIRHLHPGPR